jgi:hypothetical protein
MNHPLTIEDFEKSILICDYIMLNYKVLNRQ